MLDLYGVLQRPFSFMEIGAGFILYVLVFWKMFYGVLESEFDVVSIFAVCKMEVIVG